MFQLLKLEWLKQKDFILFRILILVYVVMLPSLLMIGKKLKGIEGELPFNPQLMLFHFPSVWGWLAYVGNWLVFFVLGFMAVLIITNEHSYRTLRQNIITGLHRGQWFWSKAWFILVLSLCATLYYAICAMMIGLYHLNDTWYLSTIFKEAEIVFRYFIMAAGYMSFGMLVGVLIKRTGIALFTFFGYAFFLEPVLRWVIHMRLIKGPSMNYYPLNVFEDLCPVPFSKLTESFAKENGFELFLDPGLSMALAVGYIFLFGVVSFWILRKSDL